MPIAARLLRGENISSISVRYFKAKTQRDFCNLAGLQRKIEGHILISPRRYRVNDKDGDVQAVQSQSALFSICSSLHGSGIVQP